MTKLLLRMFVPNYRDKASSKVRAAVGRLSGGVGIGCNAVLFGGKLTVGLLTGSVSIIADAMNNLTDAASSVVTLVGFKLAEKPADSDHPYGHARYEYLSGLAVAGLILVIGVEMLKSAVGKILNPAAVALTVPMWGILVGSILVKLWLSRFNGFLGRHIDSGTLEAAAADSRNDVLATGAVLLAALTESITGWRIDGVMGLLVSAFILYSGIGLAKQTISPLLGEGASPELRRLIVQAVLQNEKVLDYHDLMVHDYGPGQRFASIHVEMDRREDPLLCHEIIDDIERECLEKHNVHLVIHYDPVALDDPERESMRLWVDAELKQMDSRLSVHDFRIVRGKGHSNLVFDIALPLDMKGQEKKIRGKLNNALAETHQSDYRIVITFDPEDFDRA